MDFDKILQFFKDLTTTEEIKVEETIIEVPKQINNMSTQTDITGAVQIVQEKQKLYGLTNIRLKHGVPKGLWKLNVRYVHPNYKHED